MGAAGLGERGKPAEAVGDGAAEELVQDLQTGGCVDRWCAVILLLDCAGWQAGGEVGALWRRWLWLWLELHACHPWRPVCSVALARSTNGRRACWPRHCGPSRTAQDRVAYLQLHLCGALRFCMCQPDCAALAA